jgi:uncharacterized short protein YbdD (DUF466 family)
MPSRGTLEARMTEQIPDEPDQPEEQFHRDRREHGGAPDRLDTDRLARLAEEERVEAGVDDYDPDEVPPATDAPSRPDVTQTEEFQEARAEIQRELDEGELRVRGQRDPYPPSHYDRS